MKICKCGYETEKTSFQFCPLCGKQLTVLELEDDGTYKAKREACRVFDGWLDPNAIYYYKISPIDDTLAWIYTSPISKHWIIGCHISKIKPIDVERVERCALRKNGKCGYEGSTPNGKLGDILNEKFIDTLHPYQEVAIGGGNVLEHPDLIPFLEKLKGLKVITNITLNQIHFEQNIELVDMLFREKLIYGLGVSLVKPTKEFIEKVKKYPNVVIHVINGVLSPSDMFTLENNNLKLLILGYKHLRRGNEYYESDMEDIKAKQRWLYVNLEFILKGFKVVSFDNLAIEQLNVKRLLSNEEWDEFYQGDDGSSTYYIDMVERKFARSSTASFDKRYDLMDSVDDMFRKIVNEN